MPEEEIKIEPIFVKLPFSVPKGYERVFSWNLPESPMTEGEDVVAIATPEGMKVHCLKGENVYLPWLQDCIEETKEECEQLSKPHADRITDNSL